MTIIVLTNQNQYPYHSFLSKMLIHFFQKKNHLLSIMDVTSESYDHLCLQKIQAQSPDILITFDLAGFPFRTQTKEASLNMLSSKNLNLLWGNKKEYAPFLSGKLSLSMIFYDLSGKDFHLPKLYPNLQYYKASQDYCLDTHMTDVKNFSKIFSLIWEDFTTEVLLPET